MRNNTKIGQIDLAPAIKTKYNKVMSIPNNILKNGGWVKVEFLDAIVDAWCVPLEFWNSFGRADRYKGKEIPNGFILGQIAEDAPYRILKFVSRAEFERCKNIETIPK